MQCLAKMKRTQNAFRVSAITGLAAWFILSAGCARAPGPSSLPPSPSALSAEELVARLQARAAAIQTLKAQFSIEATAKDIKGTKRMEAAMIYQRPNLVRLRTFARSRPTA